MAKSISISTDFKVTIIITSLFIHINKFLTQIVLKCKFSNTYVGSKPPEL